MRILILFFCLIAIAITLNGCRKCTYYYAYCETGHAPWKGREWESCQGDHAETQYYYARMEVGDHDNKVHGGVGTAEIRSEYK